MQMVARFSRHMLAAHTWARAILISQAVESASVSLLAV